MSSVVEITDLNHGIVQMTMQDRVSHNTFSTELITAINTSFDEIEKHDSYKVVVLTGYDNYFCCGGTKNELLAIQRKDIKFNEINFFTRALDCEIPVISAMQGHGIGGGFTLGCYSDFIILGTENIYTTNFMKYGFTPGMGSTYIVPFRLGHGIGNEMLFTGRNYRGAELKDRSVMQKVVPKKNVLTEAVQLAENLAEKPRLSLVKLKEQLSRPIRDSISSVIEHELSMHELTLDNPEIAGRIESLFGH